MEKNTVVVPTGQGTPNTSQHGGAGSHLKHEVGPLQAVYLGGRGDTNNSATGRDTGRNPRRGVDRSESFGTMNGASGRNIRY